MLAVSVLASSRSRDLARVFRQAAAATTRARSSGRSSSSGARKQAVRSRWRRDRSARRRCVSRSPLSAYYVRCGCLDLAGEHGTRPWTDSRGCG